MHGLARTPGTLLHRALTNEGWTLDQHLLAVVVDQLAGANWQRSGGRGARPKPISPLAQEPEATRAGNVDGHSPEEVAALLAKYRTGAFDGG